MSADDQYKVLFERGRWQICENKGGVWVWHMRCPEMPKSEVKVNQECWMPFDANPKCIVCDKKLPDEVLALVLLYTNGV